MPQPRIHFKAPVVPIAYPHDWNDPLPYHACDTCLPWSMDLHRDEDDVVWVTEWHAVDCDFVAWWLTGAEENRDGS